MVIFHSENVHSIDSSVIDRSTLQIIDMNIFVFVLCTHQSVCQFVHELVSTLAVGINVLSCTPCSISLHGHNEMFQVPVPDFELCLMYTARQTCACFYIVSFTSE